MSEGRLADYLEHMLEASRLALSYVEGLDKDQFLADKRSQQAVILNIVVIGEAATKIVKDFPDFVEQHPELPLKNMKGMRNRIAHGSISIWTSFGAPYRRLCRNSPPRYNRCCGMWHKNDNGLANKRGKSQPIIESCPCVPSSLTR